jgi:hypothetical protein
MLKSHSNAFQWLKAHVWNGAVCLAAGSRRVPGIIWPLTWSARKNVVLIIPKPTSWCKLFVNNHHFSWRVADFFHIIHITMFCHGFPYWLLEFYDFPYIGNVIIPTDEITFFRGVGIPPTSQSLVLFSHVFPKWNQGQSASSGDDLIGSWGLESALLDQSADDAAGPFHCYGMHTQWINGILFHWIIKWDFDGFPFDENGKNTIIIQQKWHVFCCL